RHTRSKRDWSSDVCSSDLAGCDVVVRAALDNHRLAPCPLEVQAAASRFEADGRLTHWSSTQTPHMVKGALVAAYGLDADQVRVRSEERRVGKERGRGGAAQ